MLLGVSWTIDVLRVPVGPFGEEVTVRVRLPWKKFRLCRFSTIVAFDPDGRLADDGVAVKLKSVATRVRTIWCERVPSLAVNVIR